MAEGGEDLGGLLGGVLLRAALLNGGQRVLDGGGVGGDGPAEGGRGRGAGEAQQDGAGVSLGDLAQEPGGQQGLRGEGRVDGQPPVGVGPGRGQVGEPQAQVMLEARAEMGAHRLWRGVGEHMGAAVELVGRPDRWKGVGEHLLDGLRVERDDKVGPRQDAEVPLGVSGVDRTDQKGFQFGGGLPFLGHVKPLLGRAANPSTLMRTPCGPVLSLWTNLGASRPS